MLKVARDARRRRPAPRGGRGAQEAPQRVHRRPREVREIGGRTVLVLDKSGDETLAERLRKEGRLGLELLQRFGEDLLQAVASLERHGVAHRDIKPDNIGVRSGKQRLQLVLFDFSLSRAPPEHIQVGTHPYLDPFLAQRRPPRWDLAAERYAAGVTLYEMAAGVLPRWGDGQVGPGADRRRADGRGRAVRPGGPRRAWRPSSARRCDRDPGGGSTTPRRCSGPGARCSTGPSGGRSPRPAGERGPRSDVELDQADPETLVAIAGPEHPRRQRPGPRWA